MTTNVMSARRHGVWQFSLKSLMFVTMVVAVCAALVHISIPLAVLFIPLITAGLLRTLRVVTRSEANGAREAVPGVFATFCRSIALMVAMIGAGAAAISFAGVSAVLMAVMVIIHVCRATGIVSHPILSRVRRGLLKLGRWCWMALSRIKPVAVLRWFQARMVARTLSLFAICRRLSRQWWCCPPTAAFTSTGSHAGRTDPL
jgi:hypothetical protein